MSEERDVRPQEGEGGAVGAAQRRNDDETQVEWSGYEHRYHQGPCETVVSVLIEQASLKAEIGGLKSRQDNHAKRLQSIEEKLDDIMSSLATRFGQLQWWLVGVLLAIVMTFGTLILTYITKVR
jgi:tetrahydromethanopterin S-methyltransferase subunit G